MKKIVVFSILILTIILISGAGCQQQLTKEEVESKAKDWLYQKYLEECSLNENCKDKEYKTKITDLYQTKDGWKVFGEYRYESGEILYEYSDGEIMPSWTWKIFNLFVNKKGEIIQKYPKIEPELGELPNFPNMDLANYPEPFIVNGEYFDTRIVVGENSPVSDILAVAEISNSLILLYAKGKELEDIKIDGPYTDLDNEILDSYFDRKLIVVSSMQGDSCTNNLVKKFLPCKELNLNFGEGFIGYVNNGDNVALLVIGKEKEDTRMLAKVLEEPDINLKGNPIRVRGNKEKYNIEEW